MSKSASATARVWLTLFVGASVTLSDSPTPSATPSAKDFAAATGFKARIETMASAQDGPRGLTSIAIRPVRSVPVVAFLLAHVHLIQDETTRLLRVEQCDGVLHRLARGVSRAHHEYDLAGNFRQRLRFIGHPERSRIQQQDAAGNAAATGSDDRPHAVAAQEFRGALDVCAGRQDRQTVHIRGYHQRLDVHGLAHQRVQKTLFRLDADDLADMAFRHIAIHHQHRHIALERQTHGQIDAGKGLAVARKGAGDHDHSRFTDGGCARQGFFDQRTLDPPVLFRKLPVLTGFREIAPGAQFVGIERHPLRGLRRIGHMIEAGGCDGLGSSHRRTGFRGVCLIPQNGDRLFDEAHVDTCDLAAPIVSLAPAQFKVSATARPSMRQAAAADNVPTCARNSLCALLGNATLTTPSTGKPVISFTARTELTIGFITCRAYAMPAPIAMAKSHTPVRSVARLGDIGVTGAVGGSTTSNRTEPALSARSPRRAFW